ncbi:MAG: DNA-processing protein DprA [Nitratireductor sp.]|nr:DNA-processing protein DprA [Nitratireductor sp.]
MRRGVITVAGLSEQQRFDWLRLLRAENVGPATFRILINRFGGAAAALEALPGMSRRGGLSRPIRIPDAQDIEREFADAHRHGGQYVAYGEAGYPPRLAHIDQSPPLLCACGNLAVAEQPMVAIVGARNASAGGRQLARTFAHELGEAGFVVVSGLALGIDSAAHEASLDHGTVAVLAGGIGRIYPEQHLPLANRILETGMLVTEMHPTHTPRSRDFPRRNRIVSGCALGVVVIEAAARSGSLITARFALEQNREVFAVPGSPLDPRTEGTNRLIRDGAVLTGKTEHILEVIAPMLARQRDLLSNAQENGETEWIVDIPDAGLTDRLAGLLSPSPVGIDTLIRETNAPAAQVQGALLEMELAGRARRHSGNRFTASAA